MKVKKKSLRIAYWITRITALCLALLLFSITGMVATRTMTYANEPTTVLADEPIETPISTLTPTMIPSPTQVIPTATPKPTPSPTAVTHKTPTISPITTKVARPPVSATATHTVINPTTTATPGKKTPTVTPASTTTPTLPGTQTPSLPGSIDTHITHSATNTNRSMISSMTGPIIGAMILVLLALASLLALVLRKKFLSTKRPLQAEAHQLQPSPVQQAFPFGMNNPIVETPYSHSPTTPTKVISVSPTAHQPMLPFAMQVSVPSSGSRKDSSAKRPLQEKYTFSNPKRSSGNALGAASSAQADASVPPPSDFKPLPLDYPHSIETPSQQALATMLSAIDQATTQPTLQAVSEHPTSGAKTVTLSPMQTPIPPSLDIDSSPYQFPQQDPFLEALMHQAQLGLFVLPGKAASVSTGT